MRSLFLADAGVRLEARRDAFVLTRDGEALQSLPMRDVDEIHLAGGADLTAAARDAALRRGIDVLFLTLGGDLRGRLVGPLSAWPARRVAQVRAIDDPARAAAIARAIVRAKLVAQRRLLLTRNRRLRSAEIANAADALATAAARAATESDLDVLRGLEGAGANRYFSVFPHLILNADFPWSGRNRRPPRDPVNAALSFGYGVLLARVESAVRRAGLDPYLGVLHGHLRGAPACALDLAESFRPTIDALVLTLVNRRALTLHDFEPPRPGPDGEPPPEDAIHLAPLGRRILLQAWSDLRRDPLFPDAAGQRLTLDTALDAEVHALRRHIEGEAPEWTPLALLPLAALAALAEEGAAP